MQIIATSGPLNTLLESIHSRVDRDQDGGVSFDELLAARQDLPLAGQFLPGGDRLASLFEEIDGDGDGRVIVGEVRYYLERAIDARHDRVLDVVERLQRTVGDGSVDPATLELLRDPDGDGEKASVAEVGDLLQTLLERLRFQAYADEQPG